MVAKPEYSVRNPGGEKKKEQNPEQAGSVLKSVEVLTMSGRQLTAISP